MKKFLIYLICLICFLIVLPAITVNNNLISTSSLTKSAKSNNRKEKNYSDLKIKVLFYKSDNQKNGNVLSMNLEKYVKHVVAIEMPAIFNQEALKAQAVTARSYAYVKTTYTNPDHSNADICSYPGHCQAFQSTKQLKDKWGNEYDTYWEKICKAVNSTKGIVITYNNKVVSPFYFSSCEKRTENVEDVWNGEALGYLRSVKSYGDSKSPLHKRVTTISISSFIKGLKNYHPNLKISYSDPIKNYKILKRTAGGKVAVVKIGNKKFKGTEIRTAFSIPSTHFSFKKKGGNIEITTLGYGHAVGMSQYGANYMASNGKSFRKILKHYYTNIKLINIKNYT